MHLTMAVKRQALEQVLRAEANDSTVKLGKFLCLAIKVMELDLVKFLNGVDLVVDLRSGGQPGFLRREVVNWRIWWWI